MRAQARLEKMQNGKNRIVVTEILSIRSYNLVEKIAELVRDKGD